MTAAPDDHAPPSELWVGPYRLLTRIGEGGMGVVHLGQRATGERAAIKVLRPHVVPDDEARARLAREVNSLGLVRSPRVAEVLDADPWGPIPYVATRYVPGLPLHRHVQEEGALGGADLGRFAAALAEAVQAVHEVGVLHRDIKPSNVLMEGRNPVLIDFGLARLDDDISVTRTGYLLGTPGYLAPEILFGEKPTPASDVHSWAATVAFAGLARPPFGSGHALLVMDRVRNGQHDLDGLDGDIGALLLASLDPDPVRRPDLASVLRALGADPAPAHDIPFTLPFAAVPTIAPQGPATAAAAGPLAPPTLVDPQTLVDPDRQQPPAAPMAAPTRQPYQQPPQVSQPSRPPQQTAYPQTQPGPTRVGLAERLRRGVLGGGAVLATAAAIAWAPWVMTVVLVAGVCLLRAGSLAGSTLAEKRRLRGRKWYDGTVATMTAPWHFAVSLLGTGALLVWAALLAACALLTMLALGAADHVALGVSGVVFVGSLWTGPGSSRVSAPLRRVGVVMARQPLPWALWSAVLLLVAAGAFAGAIGEINWAPAPESPWAEGTWLGRWL
ncbi:serine/threonine-protein kinase [Nocardioides alcanivorans]|uniref:serine/threonine-protein kinase n=1 Tax=Nocardioides alcanivorans TaxID=2897352 RepID=UPI001F360E51|nr:serine/threonine-protein kinase [Nocardioides alcanivorans]